MASITELSLFKACVENPQHLQNLDMLNLEHISDPHNSSELTEKEYI